MNFDRRRIIGVAALLLSLGALARPILHPLGEGATDARRRYPLQVLTEALDAAGSQRGLAPYAAAAPQERNLRLLESGRIDVMWSMATNARLARARAIPLPIDFGLLGWRTLLVRDEDIPRFEGVTAESTLAGFIGLQGHDWPDTAILKANALPMETGAHYEGLFGMLLRRRADYFPRSIAEASGELGSPMGQGLARVPGVLLHYRAPLVFFVRRDDEALAKTIEAGLRALKASGRLDALFRESYGDSVHLALGPKPTIIELDNPLLDAAALDPDPAWWTLPSP